MTKLCSAVAVGGCAVFLAACAPTVKQSFSPSGATSFEISCNNAAGFLSGCYQKAGEICQSKGYSIVKEHSDAPFASIIAQCKTE